MSGCASKIKPIGKKFISRLRLHVKHKSSQQSQTSQSSNEKNSTKSYSSDDDFEPAKKVPLSGESSRNDYEEKMDCDERMTVPSDKNSQKKKNRKRKISKAPAFSPKKTRTGPIEKFFPPCQNEKKPQANDDSQSKIRCVKTHAVVNSNDKCLMDNGKNTTNNGADAENSSADDSAILMLDINNGHIDTDVLEYLNSKAQVNEEDIIATLSTTLRDEKSPKNGIDPVQNNASSSNIVVNKQSISQNNKERPLELPNSSANDKSTVGRLDGNDIVTTASEIVVSETSEDKPINIATSHDIADNATTEKETHIINNETFTSDTNEANGMPEDDLDDVLNLDCDNDFSDNEENISIPSKQTKKTQRVATSTKPTAGPQSVSVTCIPKVSSTSLPAETLTSKQSNKISTVSIPNKRIIHLDTALPISARGRRLSVKANNMRFVPNPSAPLPALMDIHINNPHAQNEQTLAETPATVQLKQSIQKTIEKRLSISADSAAKQNIKAAETIPAPNAESRLVLPSFAKNPNSDLPGFKILFPNTCRRFMGNFCTSNPSRCQWEHFLPDTAVVRAQLNYLGIEEVYIVYDVFLLRLVKLFTKYFPQFCDYFGSNNKEEYLIQMVNDCIHPVRRCSCFFTDIINGLMKTGLTFENAIRKVINSVAKPNFQSMNQLVGLILENHYDVIISFLDVLKTFSEKENYKFDRRWIHKLIKIYFEKPNTELNQLIWSIISKAETDVDQTLLTKFMDKTTEIMAMNEIINNIGN